MKTRQARNQAEIDFLPPFGEPEVVVVGPAALAVGGAAALVVLQQLGE